MTEQKLSQTSQLIIQELTDMEPGIEASFGIVMVGVEEAPDEDIPAICSALVDNGVPYTLEFLDEEDIFSRMSEEQIAKIVIQAIDDNPSLAHERENHFMKYIKSDHLKDDIRVAFDQADEKMAPVEPHVQ